MSSHTDSYCKDLASPLRALVQVSVLECALELARGTVLAVLLERLGSRSP